MCSCLQEIEVLLHVNHVFLNAVERGLLGHLVCAPDVDRLK